MTGEPKRHNISDWLALHDLDPSLCRQILSAVARKVGSPTAGQSDVTSEDYALDPDVAWRRVLDAMCAFFPAQQNIIEGTFEKMLKIPVMYGQKTRRALTLDNGDGAYPTVIYTHFGKMPDLMLVAHEFAHAIQIVASKGKFVTPIIRELCAFVGEMVLLTHSQNTDEGLYGQLRKIWCYDNEKYFTDDREELNDALHSPYAGYRYCWNYPIARYLAIEISDKLARERMWLLFEGSLNVREVLQELEGEIS